LITMNVFKGNNSNQSDKDIVTKPSNVEVEVDDAAKANTPKLCDCPGSKPGKINLDIYAHLPGCHIRKRLQSGRFTINTSVNPRRISDGFSLGVVLGEEGF
jgi:hypothetical protein